jgi:hypothetical protein
MTHRFLLDRSLIPKTLNEMLEDYDHEMAED